MYAVKIMQKRGMNFTLKLVQNLPMTEVYNNLE